MAHTPGPWGVQRVKGSYLVPFHVLAEDGKPVAYCEGDQLRPDRTGIGEARANARLIAAAPELLAALKDCRDWLVAICDSTKLEETERGYLEAATNAIAKAEGRGK